MYVKDLLEAATAARRGLDMAVAKVVPRREAEKAAGLMCAAQDTADSVFPPPVGNVHIKTTNEAEDPHVDNDVTKVQYSVAARPVKPVLKKFPTYEGNVHDVSIKEVGDPHVDHDIIKVQQGATRPVKPAFGETDAGLDSPTFKDVLLGAKVKRSVPVFMDDTGSEGIVKTKEQLATEIRDGLFRFPSQGNNSAAASSESHESKMKYEYDSYDSEFPEMINGPPNVKAVPMPPIHFFIRVFPYFPDVPPPAPSKVDALGPGHKTMKMYKKTEKLSLPNFESFNKLCVLSNDDNGNKLEYVDQTNSLNKNKNYVHKKAKKLGSGPPDVKLIPMPPPRFFVHDHNKPMRGGGDSESDIFDNCNKNAKHPGINLLADAPNAARGDCLFESVSQNINKRLCFEEKVSNNIDDNRTLWVTELEERFKETDHFPGYNGDISEEMLNEWTSTSKMQKNPQEYYVNHFNVSDIALAGLGHCVGKDILVFDSNNIEDPVKVFDANLFDPTRSLDTDIPVIIAYDSRAQHYESLIPKGKADINKTILLVRSILGNSYDKNNPRSYLKLSDAEKKAAKIEYNHKRFAKRSTADKEILAKNEKGNCHILIYGLKKENFLGV